MKHTFLASTFLTVNLPVFKRIKNVRFAIHTFRNLLYNTNNMHNMSPFMLRASEVSANETT
jgi:hypothetical protein